MFLNYGAKTGNVFKDVMSYVDRNFLTQYTTPISLIKQNMHILIMFHGNHCWFILTTLPTIIQKH